MPHIRRELPDDVGVQVPPESFGAPLVQVLRQARARDRQSHTAELLERAGEVPRLTIGILIYVYVCVLVPTAITVIAAVYITAVAVRLRIRVARIATGALNNPVGEAAANVGYVLA